MITPTVLPRRLGRVEFTALLALSIALAALGIDIILPALGRCGPISGWLPIPPR